MQARRLAVRTGASPLIVSLALLVGAGDARATDPPSHSLDAFLLNTNSIVFATVKGIVADPNGRDFTVTFVRVAAAYDRVGLATSPTLTLRLRGVPQRSELQVSRSLPRLAVEIRYLLLLQGDGRDGVALVDHAQSIYRLGEGGIECAGGHLYGLGTDSFVCSTPDWHYGTPITEAALRTWVGQAFDRARDRYPEVAASPRPVAPYSTGGRR